MVRWGLGKFWIRLADSWIGGSVDMAMVMAISFTWGNNLDQYPAGGIGVLKCPWMTTLTIYAIL